MVTDDSSQSGGSQSSIDIAELNEILANATYPGSDVMISRARARARGQGHQRRISEARRSRTSIYDIISEASEEEQLEESTPPSPDKSWSDQTVKTASATRSPIIVVEHGNNEGSWEGSWNDDSGALILHKYYALQNEVEHEIVQSRVVWPDTPFSVFALQCKPEHPSHFPLNIGSFSISFRPSIGPHLHPGAAGALRAELSSTASRVASPSHSHKLATLTISCNSPDQGLLIS